MKKEINPGRRATTWPVFGGILLLSTLGFQAPVVGQVTFTRITEGDLATDTGQFFSQGWADYDQDGLLDVAMGSQRQNRKMRLYHNDGNSSFTRITEGILVTDPVSPSGLSWIDPDNDGDLDLFVSTFNGLANQFYQNDGNGEFTRVTEGAWVNTLADANGPVWGDYDNDGLIDLYMPNDNAQNELYHNNGDGTMTRINTVADLSSAPSRGVAWSDYDNDGDVDLFVSDTTAVQFRNDGDGVFSVIRATDGGIAPYQGTENTGLGVADYDNDGDLDVFLAAFDRNPMNMLHRNDGQAGFVRAVDVIPSGGVINAVIPAWGDYDNDGHPDLFLTNHNGKNLLYHNDGDGSFSLVSDSPAVRESLASADVRWVDYDNDGDLDLHVANGFSEGEQVCELYRNDGGTNHWIAVTLTGVDTNRMGVGAKVRIRATIGGKEIEQLREVSSSDLRVHFGLGDAETISNLTIEWPSGAVQMMKNVSADQFLTVTEMNMGGKLANISTRGQVGTGDSVLIAGLVITGATPQTVLIRASGATLADYGVSDVLADTLLTVFDSDDNEIATNTNWGDATNATEIAAAITRVGAFDLPSDSTDSAILITLDPGAYTAQVSGNGGATGNALVEVYGVD